MPCSHTPALCTSCHHQLSPAPSLSPTQLNLFLLFHQLLLQDNVLMVPQFGGLILEQDTLAHHETLSRRGLEEGEEAEGEVEEGWNVCPLSIVNFLLLLISPQLDILLLLH